MPYLAAPVMGTTVSIDVRDEGIEPAVLEEALEVLRELDARFSTYRDDSEIKRIERGELSTADAHPDVREVLDACAVLRAESGGAFDAWRGGRLDPSGYVKGWAAERARMALVLGVRDGAVATSGSYERGEHLVDGRTGRVAAAWCSITVVPPDLATADAIATAAFAMGEPGPEWAARRHGCEVATIGPGGRLFTTAGLERSRLA